MKKVRPKYFSLVADVLNVLPPIKDSQDSEDLSKALTALIDLAEIAPKMFKPLFRNLVQFSVSVIQDKELGDVCRQNALELMATFADYAPSICRKDISYTSDMITQCLSLMTDIGEDDDDAAEWLTLEDVSSKLPVHLSSSILNLTLAFLSPTRTRATRTMWLASRPWIASRTVWAERPFWRRLSTGSRG